MGEIIGAPTAWWRGVPRENTVYRWQNHPACELGRYRLQSNDDHRREMLTLLGSVLAGLGPLGVHLDKGLLYRAVLHHDDGEDIIGGDVLYALKSGERDVEEYRAFVDVVQPLVSNVVWRDLHRAFLLQFVRKYHNSAMFPAEARSVMERLVRAHWAEATLFMFLERLDYLLYALEQWDQYDNPHFIREVFPNQYIPLDALTEEIPGLADFWRGSGLRIQCGAVVKTYGPLTVEKTGT